MSTSPVSGHGFAGDLLDRRRLLLGCAAGFALSSRRAGAQAGPNYFRIATGTTSGTYFPIGGLIASAISDAPGGPSCDKGGSCGVRGLIAVAQATSGAVENINLLKAGAVEAAFTQSDTAYWAYTGTGSFNAAPFDALRSLGTLYTEAMHLVVRAESDIRTPADIRGHTVSVGEAASGTLADVRLILDAYGLTDGSLTVLNLRLGTAAERLARGELDAFFIVGGTPLPAVSELAAKTRIRLVPFDDEAAASLLRRYRFFRPMQIPAGTYSGTGDILTLGVGAELVTSARIADDLIYDVTRALWNDNTRRLLAEGHPRGRSFSVGFAVAAAAIPLHAGAERYYRDSGALPKPETAPAPTQTPTPAPAPTQP